MNKQPFRMRYLRIYIADDCAERLCGVRGVEGPQFALAFQREPEPLRGDCGVVAFRECGTTQARFVDDVTDCCKMPGETLKIGFWGDPGIFCIVDDVQMMNILAMLWSIRTMAADEGLSLGAEIAAATARDREVVGRWLASATECFEQALNVRGLGIDPDRYVSEAERFVDAAAGTAVSPTAGRHAMPDGLLEQANFAGWRFLESRLVFFSREDDGLRPRMYHELADPRTGFFDGVPGDAERLRLRALRMNSAGQEVRFSFPGMEKYRLSEGTSYAVFETSGETGEEFLRVANDDGEAIWVSASKTVPAA